MDLTPDFSTSLPLLLASASPRRKQLLAQIGIKPAKIAASSVDETPLNQELPRIYVQRIAHSKLAAAQKHYSDFPFILAADTVTAVGRRILLKTEDPHQAEKHLRLLSGRRHRVYTTVILFNVEKQKCSTRLVCTIVNFSRLTEKQLQTYLETQEWRGKAGAYAIQGYAARFIQTINGSYSNVVGLPLFETSQLLRGQGLIL